MTAQEIAAWVVLGTAVLVLISTFVRKPARAPAQPAPAPLVQAGPVEDAVVNITEAERRAAQLATQKITEKIVTSRANEHVTKFVEAASAAG